ncbi:hypothetical protein AMS62_03330 [Bacillus sp. FJAT-18019]|nr:hypothetical protein AMS62_03330 [Bacillus sp. FJAT-18019]
MTTPQSPAAAAYIASVQALRASSASLLVFVEQDQNDPDRLRELERQRQNAYLNWSNSVHYLRTLPVAEMAAAMDQIETALGYQ